MATEGNTFASSLAILNCPGDMGPINDMQPHKTHCTKYAYIPLLKVKVRGVETYNNISG